MIILYLYYTCKCRCFTWLELFGIILICNCFDYRRFDSTWSVALLKFVQVIFSPIFIIRSQKHLFCYFLFTRTSCMIFLLIFCVWFFLGHSLLLLMILWVDCMCLLEEKFGGQCSICFKFNILHVWVFQIYSVEVGMFIGNKQQPLCKNAVMIMIAVTDKGHCYHNAKHWPKARDIFRNGSKHCFVTLSLIDLCWKYWLVF